MIIIESAKQINISDTTLDIKPINTSLYLNFEINSILEPLVTQGILIDFMESYCVADIIA